MKQIILLLILFSTLLTSKGNLIAQNIYIKKPSIGSGTGSSPFQISTAEELRWFANYINEDENNTQACAILTANIDLNPGFIFTTRGYIGTGIPEKWRPIGNYYKYWRFDKILEYKNMYSGTFDGNGYTISGLYINNEIEAIENQGLFGALDKDGIIKNIKLKNGYIYNSLIQGIAVGGICGFNHEGEIVECNVDISIKTDEINGWYSLTLSSAIGGICGKNEKGVIKKCKNANNIIINKSIYEGMTGGICGENEGHIKNCSNTGSITFQNGNTSFIGGICGYNTKDYKAYEMPYGSISNCYNTGNVSFLGEMDAEIGGICGLNGGLIIENCYNTGTIITTDDSKIGGICGSNGGKIINSYNIGIISTSRKNSVIGGICGSNHTEVLINCYNAGIIKTGNAPNCFGGICGTGEYNTIQNCFYLKGTAEAGIGESDSEATSPTVKNVRDFVKSMNSNNGFTLNNEWTTSANYGNGILKLPTLGGEDVIPTIMVSDDDPTHVETINATSCHIYTQEGNLAIFTPQREQVYIFNINGSIVSSQQQLGLHFYNKLPKGFYIVRIGKEIFKVNNR